jgi:hypothetical protein
VCGVNRLSSQREREIILIFPKEETCIFSLSLSLSIGSVLALVSSLVSFFHVSLTTPTTRLGWRHTNTVVSNCLGLAVHDLFFFFCFFLLERTLLTHVLDTLPYLTLTPASPIVLFYSTLALIRLLTRFLVQKYAFSSKCLFLFFRMSSTYDNDMIMHQVKKSKMCLCFIYALQDYRASVVFMNKSNKSPKKSIFTNSAKRASPCN